MKGILKRFRSVFIFYFVLLSLFTSCKDKITNPPIQPINGNYLLCYCGKGNIVINNIMGSNPQIISYGGSPDWSPDGRYIVYQRLRSDTIFSPFVYVYDVKNKTYTNLTSDGGLASSSPHWTRNGKVYFSYEIPVPSPTVTYLMNPDGSNKKKILNDSAAVIYFYPDSYTFLYFNGTKVYKTNIDNTYNEFICDVNYPGIEGFNPYTEEFLIVTSSNGKSVVATYSIKTCSLNILLTAEVGYGFMQLRYSSNYSKIALIEHGDNNEYLSILENGVKGRLVRIPANFPPVCFSYEPMQFSPDDKYIAYDKQVFGSGAWVNFREYLYVVDVSNGNTQYIDEGIGVAWSLKP